MSGALYLGGVMTVNRFVTTGLRKKRRQEKRKKKQKEKKTRKRQENVIFQRNCQIQLLLNRKVDLSLLRRGTEKSA